MNTTETIALPAPQRGAKLRRSRTPLVIAAALIGGVIGGAGGFAVAASPGMDGWRQERHLEWMQRRVHGALDAVGATTLQEDKIHDIIAAAFANGDQAAAQRRDLRRQMIELLRAPTIDRAAVEKLRQDGVAAYDARSKATVGAILDAADQLTPDQRTKLADRMMFMMQHRHGMHEGWRGHDGRDGQDGDRGPTNGGPDRGGDQGGSPDKG